MLWPPSQQVSWESTVGFYASLAQPIVGSVLLANSTLPDASANRIYTLGATLIFSGPAAGGGAGDGVYAVDNRYTSAPSITLGLIQDVEVNGQISKAGLVVAQASASPFRSTFQLLEVVYISLRSDAVDGRIFDPSSAAKTVVGPLTALDFGPLGSSLVATYDPTTGGFMVSSSG